MLVRTPPAVKRKRPGDLRKKMNNAPAPHVELERFLGNLFFDVVALDANGNELFRCLSASQKSPERKEKMRSLANVIVEPLKPAMSFDDMAAELGVSRQQAEREYWQALKSFICACYARKHVITTEEQVVKIGLMLPNDAFVAMAQYIKDTGEQLALFATEKRSRLKREKCQKCLENDAKQIQLGV